MLYGVSQYVIIKNISPARSVGVANMMDHMWFLYRHGQEILMSYKMSRLPLELTDCPFQGVGLLGVFFAAR